MKPVSDRYASARTEQSVSAAEQQQRILTLAAYEANLALPWILALLIASGLFAIGGIFVGVLSVAEYGPMGAFTLALGLTTAFLSWSLWRLHRSIYVFRSIHTVVALTQTLRDLKFIFASVAVFLFISVAFNFTLRVSKIFFQVPQEQVGSFEVIDANFPT